jgi:hypothetical protein
VKKELLGVTADALEKHGAVSEQVALQMAAGIRERTGADVGVSVTGIAGPGGGTPEKPVGLIWVAVNASDAKARRFHVGGDRAEIRQRAAQAALADARPSGNNLFKIELAKRILVRTLTLAAAGTPDRIAALPASPFSVATGALHVV